MRRYLLTFALVASVLLGTVKVMGWSLDSWAAEWGLYLAICAITTILVTRPRHDGGQLGRGQSRP